MKVVGGCSYTHVSFISVADSEIFERERKTMHQPRRRLSQLHTTNYVPCVQEKTNIEIILRPTGGALIPYESATDSNIR